MFDRIVCADWSRDPRRRGVFVAEVAERRIFEASAADVAGVLALARERTLIGFDASLAVSESFLRATGKASFVEWWWEGAFARCEDASRWSPEAPFFAVPKGRGALQAFERAAAQRGVALRRRIEVATGAKPTFVVAGIPGCVGAASLDVWEGLRSARRRGVSFGLWPFEETLPRVAETYPRACYATALIEESPRARLSIAKSDARLRARALERLRTMNWARDVELAIGRAEESEDAFDALMSAAALLRCALEDLPMHGPVDRVEGAILGTGTIDLRLAERVFSASE